MNEFKPRPLSNDSALLLKGFLHDLNNLFTCVLSSLGLAQASVDYPEQQQENIAIARKATMKATELASLLINVCAGYDLHKERYAIQTIIENSITIAKGSITTILEWKVPDQCCYICVNEAAIISVLVNLLLNADHAIKGKGTIRVECSIPEDTFVEGDCMTSEYILIKIIDSGCGFQEYELNTTMQQLLEYPFKQHGIGLRISSTIIELHGGTLTISSESGKGSVAVIRLPIAKPHPIIESHDEMVQVQ